MNQNELDCHFILAHLCGVDGHKLKLTIMEILIAFAIIIPVFIFVIYVNTADGYKNNGKQSQLSKADIIANEQRKIKEAQQNREWNELLARRESQYGKLTKEIQYMSREKNIYLYQDAKVIVLENVEYQFSDIVSVKIETRVEKGKETHVTKPDEGELAVQKMLYGMNKSYNVKEITTVTKTPDVTYYTVYIYINNLNTPCLKYNLGRNAERANNICALIEVIVRSNSNKS